MGMFDSFYFEDGVLPDNKVEANHEFQTKELDCDLDDYRVDSKGNVKKWIMNGICGRIVDETPINENVVVYSHVFLYDNPKDLKNRKLKVCLYQAYELEIKDSVVTSAKKIRERGYEEVSSQIAKQYDRMNPTLQELLERLREYASISYGTEAYPLSAAEAQLLLDSVSHGTHT